MHQPATQPTMFPAPAVPRVAAVRIGNGRAVHAGHRVATLPGDPPAYAAQHGTPGRSGPAVGDAVTCARCVGTDAARRVTAGQAVAALLAALAEAAAAAGIPADATPAAPDLDRLGADDADAYQWAAALMPDAVRAVPALVWAVVAAHTSPADDGTPAARRSGRVLAAVRAVYGLPVGTPRAEVVAAADTDTRDPDTRARDYLAAYAAGLHAWRIGRLSTLDHMTALFESSDADQRAAGVRPASGTAVRLAGERGAFLVVDRPRYAYPGAPFGVRVIAPGGDGYRTVPLAAIVRDVPAVADGMRPVILHVDSRDDVYEVEVHDACTGARVGSLWRGKRGAWHAYVCVAGTSPAAASAAATADVFLSAAEALAAHGWAAVDPADVPTAPAVLTPES